MCEDVDVGEEDGRVELEQTFAQDHTEGWTKHQKTDIQDVSQKHHSFGFSWKKSAYEKNTAWPALAGSPMQIKNVVYSHDDFKIDTKNSWSVLQVFKT